MDTLILSLAKSSSALLNSIALFLQTLTLVQSSIAIGVIILVVGVWFFSDGFTNLRNATAYIFSYAALCFLVVMAYMMIRFVAKTL